jgi:hypothetical protein
MFISVVPWGQAADQSYYLKVKFITLRYFTSAEGAKPPSFVQVLWSVPVRW